MGLPSFPFFPFFPFFLLLRKLKRLNVVAELRASLEDLLQEKLSLETKRFSAKLRTGPRVPQTTCNLKNSQVQPAVGAELTDRILPVWLAIFPGCERTRGCDHLKRRNCNEKPGADLFRFGIHIAAFSQKNLRRSLDFTQRQRHVLGIEGIQVTVGCCRQFEWKTWEFQCRGRRHGLQEEQQLLQRIKQFQAEETSFGDIKYLSLLHQPPTYRSSGLAS